MKLQKNAIFMQMQSNILNFCTPAVDVAVTVVGLHAPTLYEYAQAKIYISKINTMTFLVKYLPSHAIYCENTWTAMKSLLNIRVYM